MTQAKDCTALQNPTALAGQRAGKRKCATCVSSFMSSMLFFGECICLGLYGSKCRLGQIEMFSAEHNACSNMHESCMGLSRFSAAELLLSGTKRGSTVKEREADSVSQLV